LELRDVNIKRQYSLPNCTLILEGLSDDLSISDSKNGKSLLSLLVNVECHFVSINQKLQGGREFLESLVNATSAYAQECLSGVRHPQETQLVTNSVRIDKVAGTKLHRLAWQPSAETNEQPVEIELTTVQLFDLVEAVDQFIADSRTLPDLSLKLQPVSRRYRQPDEPLAQRVVPATVGLVGIAVSALVFFLIPVPEVRKPEETKPQPNPTQTNPNNQQSPAPGATPSPTPPN
jgi:hypothetical protein